MLKEKIKTLLVELNKDNIEEIKPKLIKYINLSILSLDEREEDLSQELLEKMLVVMDFRNEFRNENDLNIKCPMLEKFTDIYNRFIDELVDEGYLLDAIQLTNDVLKGNGGQTRLVKLMHLNKETNYLGSAKQLQDLKEELNYILKKRCCEGLSIDFNVVIGLIYSIEYYLEQSIQGHGRDVIAFLTNHKTLDVKSVNEFMAEPHTEKAKLMVDRNYVRELQRRIYHWKALTLDLTDHYCLEDIYEE